MNTHAFTHRAFNVEMDVYFTEDTPVLSVDSVYAKFRSNRSGLQYMCHLTHFSQQKTDCEFILEAK